MQRERREDPVEVCERGAGEAEQLADLHSWNQLIFIFYESTFFHLDICRYVEALAAVLPYSSRTFFGVFFLSFLLCPCTRPRTHAPCKV